MIRSTFTMCQHMLHFKSLTAVIFPSELLITPDNAWYFFLTWWLILAIIVILTPLRHWITPCLPYGAWDYNVHKHCIPKGDDELFAEQFAWAMSSMVSHYRRATNPDSQQLCQEVRTTAICFSKQISAETGVITSCSPLHVKGHAFSDTAWNKYQQQPSPNEDKVKVTDWPRVKVIKKNNQLQVKVVTIE